MLFLMLLMLAAPMPMNTGGSDNWCPPGTWLPSQWQSQDYRYPEGCGDPKSPCFDFWEQRVKRGPELIVPVSSAVVLKVTRNRVEIPASLWRVEITATGPYLHVRIPQVPGRETMQVFVP